MLNINYLEHSQKEKFESFSPKMNAANDRQSGGLFRDLFMDSIHKVERDE